MRQLSWYDLLVPTLRGSPRHVLDTKVESKTCLGHQVGHGSWINRA